MAGPRHVCRILVVDDDALVRDAVKDILESEGYPVETAANGAVALPIVEADPPEIVVLDMRMPVMDGWDFAQELKARGISIPILVLTAHQHAEVWAREIEAADFVAKPYDLLDLLGKVERLCPRGVSAPRPPVA